MTGVITRGAGGWFDLDDVLTQRGIQAALVAGCNTVAGLGHIFSMSVIREAGFTADENTDIRAKLNAARAALERYPLVYVHIKATDLFAHDFQPSGKRDFIERIDRAMHMLEGSGAAIALTADHTTDSNTGAHTADPVPVFFYTPSGQPGGHSHGINFGETACRAGTMQRQTGHEFLLRIADYLDS